MKVTRILHHSINVEGRLDEAADFYSTVVGLPSTPRPEIPGVAGRWFELGDAQLHLVDAPVGAGPIRPTGPHVCLAVDDLEAAVAELAALGIQTVRGAQGPVVQIWFVDPLGHTIELQQETRA
jgi:catechol 2,3-dioxygenase-like lactoylglutathione lyase family enzyme